MVYQRLLTLLLNVFSQWNNGTGISSFRISKLSRNLICKKKTANVKFGEASSKKIFFVASRNGDAVLLSSEDIVEIILGATDAEKKGDQ